MTIVSYADQFPSYSLSKAALYVWLAGGSFLLEAKGHWTLY